MTERGRFTRKALKGERRTILRPIPPDADVLSTLLHRGRR